MNCNIFTELIYFKFFGFFQKNKYINYLITYNFIFFVNYNKFMDLIYFDLFNCFTKKKKKNNYWTKYLRN